MLGEKQGRNETNVAFVSTGLCDLGIRSLSAYLKEKGYGAKQLFLNADSRYYGKKILGGVAEAVKDSDVICISLLSLNLDKTIELTNFLKKQGKPIIWGGCLATTCPELCIDFNDILCIGEGEEAIFELIEKMRLGKNFHNTKNFWFKINGKIIKNNPRPLIQDLDCLPFPDFSGEQYFLENGKIIKNRENALYCDHIVYGKQKAVFVFSMRGCAYDCNYCSNSKYQEVYAKQGFVRKISINRLIEHLCNIKQEFPALEYVYIYDDDFFQRTIEEIREFSGKYKTLIGLPFHAYSTPKTMREERLELLIGAGLKDVDMGIQTGSNRINKYLFNRGMQLNNEVLRAARILNKFKGQLNPPYYDFIINNPLETEEDLFATIELLKKLPKPFFLYGHSLVFIPGTRLYNKGVEEKLIDSDFDLGMVETWLNPFAYFLRRRKNIYLNTLICLMWGEVTEKSYGVIPAKLLDFLTHKKVAKLMNFLSPLVLVLDFFIPTPNRIYFLFKKIKSLKNSISNV